MASRRNRELQRYADGELSRRRAEKVRQQVEASSDDQRRLANLQSMRELLQQSTQESVEEADFSRLWGKVQAGIAAHQAPTLGERVRAWFRSYGLMAATATAAGVLALFLWLPAETTHNDCDIESLDADPGAMSTIFTIDTPEDGNKTTVIWVNELGQPIPDDDATDAEELAPAVEGEAH